MDDHGTVSDLAHQLAPIAGELARDAVSIDVVVSDMLVCISPFSFLASAPPTVTARALGVVIESASASDYVAKLLASRESHRNLA